MRLKLVGIILFLGIFQIYLNNMAPTVSEGDSGEFITASHHLSIPHAPGYPLYTSVGKVFENLFPFGNIGYRINLVSAFCAAGAAVALFLTLLMLETGTAAACAVAMLLAFSSHFFENAVVVSCSRW